MRQEIRLASDSRWSGETLWLYTLENPYGTEIWLPLG